MRTGARAARSPLRRPLLLGRSHHAHLLPAGLSGDFFERAMSATPIETWSNIVLPSYITY